MKDLEKMTKEELKKELKNSRFLASTIEVKDKEISDLKKQIQDLSTNKMNSTKQEKQIESLKQNNKVLIEQIENTGNNINYIMSKYNEAIQRNVNLLKVLEGAVDTAVALHEYTQKDFQNIVNKLSNK